MKRTISNIIVVTAIVITAIWGSPMRAAAAPDGYKTYELTGFYVDIPDEFNKSEGWSSDTNMRLDSDKSNLWDDGDEYSSSATIDVYDFEGSVSNLNEYAQNMLWSVKALDEECDEPVVEGNTIVLRSTSEVGDGYLINWRFLVAGEDGKVAGGTISYRSEEAKYYDDIVTPIIQSVRFK